MNDRENIESKGENTPKSKGEVYRIETFRGIEKLTDDPITDERLPAIANLAKTVAFRFGAEQCDLQYVELRGKSYCEDGGKTQFGVISSDFGSAFFNSKTRKIVCEKRGTEKEVFLSLLHENIHASSYLKTNQVKTDRGVKVENWCGLRKTVFFVIKGEDEVPDGQSYNRALNEGLTETLAARAHASIGIHNKKYEVYFINVLAAKQLESLVGRELMNNAYYAGAIEPLIDRVNALLEDADGWTAFNRELDIAARFRESVTCADEIKEIHISTLRVERMLEKMNVTKIKEEFSYGTKNS